jgi:tetratricopeptide (TPR) repeat protein
VADAMQRVYGERITQRAADISYHLYQAGTSSDADRTVQFLVVSAEQALNSAAFVEALEYCRNADSVESVRDRGLSAKLALTRGAALRGCGRWADARDAFDEARRVFDELGEMEAMATAAVSMAEIIGWEGKWALGLETMRATFDRLPNTPTPARSLVLSLLGAYLAAIEMRLDDARVMFEESRSIGRALGAPPLVGFANLAAEKAAFTLAHFDECIAAGDDAVRDLAAPGQRMYLVEAMSLRHLSLLSAARLQTAETERRSTAAMANDAGALLALVFCDIERHVSAFIQSGDARALSEWADANMASGKNPAFALLLQHYGIMAKHLAGHTAEALAATRRLLAHPTAIAATSGVFESVELLLMAELEDPDWDARANACAHLIPDADRPTTMWRTQFALNFARALVRRGEFARAAALLPFLRAAEARGARLMQLSITEDIIGLVHAGVGDWAAAEARFESAYRLGEELKSRLACAEIEHHYAWMLARRREGDDRDRARQMLDSVIDTFGTLGLLQPLSDARSLHASL